MTSDDAVRIARDFAAVRGWTWLEPVRARASRAWWVGPLRWQVSSNSENIGCNVRAEIDDRTGEVLRAHFVPR